MSNRFEGKVAIVTGGGSGIGGAVARRLLAEGGAVMISGRTQKRLARNGGNPAGRPHRRLCRGCRGSDCDALVAATVERFGRVDTLVGGPEWGK